MDRFENEMRVRVTDPDPDKACLRDRVGCVVRLRYADDAAWVCMVDPLPKSLTLFPDKDERRDYVMLWPEECTQLIPVPA